MQPEWGTMIIHVYDLETLNLLAPWTDFPGEVNRDNLELFHSYMHYCADRFMDDY